MSILINIKGCDILNLGQYLQPTKNHVAVELFLSPEEFEIFKEVLVGLNSKGTHNL